MYRGRLKWASDIVESRNFGVENLIPNKVKNCYSSISTIEDQRERKTVSSELNVFSICTSFVLMTCSGTYKLRLSCNLLYMIN